MVQSCGDILDLDENVISPAIVRNHVILEEYQITIGYMFIQMNGDPIYGEKGLASIDFMAPGILTR